jgi:23S rRNA pseudouridine1911/1915/1917 synthase
VRGKSVIANFRNREPPLYTNMTAGPIRQILLVQQADHGTRLDRWVVTHFPELSRARAQELIESGLILLDGAAAKASQKLRGGESITVEARQRPPLRAEPESIALEVLYEDDDLLVINKPAGMSVHAGAGNSRGTLVNALLGRGQSLSRGGAGPEEALRPGIVHRLDKETSGVIVVAKNDYAHAKLAASFHARTVKKDYLALVEGQLEKSTGKIDLPIGRDPVHRTRMKAFKPGQRRAAGQMREALTEWHKLVDFDIATLVAVQLHTGRTHQIRVHFSAVKHPLVGDSLYGAGKGEVPAVGRQFLHAAKLGFAHPRTGLWVEARAPLAQDLRTFLNDLALAEGRSLDAAYEYL